MHIKEVFIDTYLIYSSSIIHVYVILYVDRNDVIFLYLCSGICIYDIFLLLFSSEWELI